MPLVVVWAIWNCCNRVPEWLNTGSFIWFNLILFTHLFCHQSLFIAYIWMCGYHPYQTLSSAWVKEFCFIYLHFASTQPNAYNVKGTWFTPARWTLRSGVVQGQYSGLPGKGTCRNEVVLTWMQDAEEEEKKEKRGSGKEKSQPSSREPWFVPVVFRTRAGDAASETQSCGCLLCLWWGAHSHAQAWQV